MTELGEVKLDSLQRMMHLEDVGVEVPEQSLLCGGQLHLCIQPFQSCSVLLRPVLIFPPAQNELLETFVRISVN